MSVTEHAASIREDVVRHTGRNNLAVARYAGCAARWTLIRLLQRRGDATDAHNRQYPVLTERLRQLSAQLGLPTCTGDENAVGRIGNRDIPIEPVLGVTDALGYLPYDMSALLGETWWESAEVWHGIADWQ